MNRRTWACFDCRAAVRREAFGDDAEPRCPACREPMTFLGHRIEVPRHRDAPRWRRLRERLRSDRWRALESAHRNRVRTRHDLEQAIASLASSPDSKQRRAELRKLERRLRRLDGH